jgi:hypothetical protein
MYLTCKITDKGPFISQEVARKLLQPPVGADSDSEVLNLWNLQMVTQALKAKLHIDSFPMGETSITFTIPVLIPLASRFVSRLQSQIDSVNS